MQHIKTGLLLASATLTSQQLNDIQLGSRLMGCLWQAGEETGTLEIADVRARGRCLLASSALIDALHALGRADAAFHRSGLNLSMYQDGEIETSVTAGHPSAPANSPLWNAHMTVRLGDVIFDPTFGQLQEEWNSLPLFTSFVRDRTARSTFDLYDFGEVEAIASTCWQTGRRTYAARLFRLPHKVDVATRKWRGRPDAMPERRVELVQRTLELITPDAVSAPGAGSKGRRNEDDQA